MCNWYIYETSGYVMLNFNRRISAKSDVSDFRTSDKYGIIELCSPELSEYKISYYVTLKAGNYSKKNLAELLNFELNKLKFSISGLSARIIVTYNEFIDCFQIATCGTYGAVFDFSDNIKRIYTNFNGMSPLYGPDQFINLYKTIKDEIYISDKSINEGDGSI